MAQMNYAVDTNLVEEDRPKIVPAGDYTAIIENSEMKKTKSGTGEYLSLTWQIVDGNFKGRLLFENLNLVNPNTTAVEIAKRSLNSIMVAAGIDSLTDSSQLHNKPMTIKVAVKGVATDQYGQSNVIKKHSALSGSAPAPSQGSEEGKSPWEA